MSDSLTQSANQTTNPYPWAAYVKRKITITMRLASAGTGSSGGGVDSTSSNTVRIEGLRVIANITNVGNPGAPTAMIRVYGLTLNHINQFTAAGFQWYASGKNLVMLEAGDDQSGMSVVFNGIITEAYPDFSDLPNSAFVIMAHAGVGIQLKPVKPSSFQGSIDAATAFSTIADKAEVKLENNGVQGKLDNPYFPGTAWNQITQCTKAVGCFSYLDSLTNTLAIWPKNGSRGGDPAIMSADNGMIGYPAFQANSVMFRTLFNPKVRFGGKVTSKTQFTAANGDWIVRAVDYHLSSEMPNGPWEMIITTYRDSFQASS